MPSLRLLRALRLFLIPALILITSVPASAGTFYVRTDGNDSNSGLENTPSGAWATIQKAADSLKAGDTAEIQAGTYNEDITITTSGTPEEYIVFRAKGEVIISAEGPSIKLDGANYIRLEGLTCKSTTTAGISLVNSNNNILVRNVSSSTTAKGIEADSVSTDNQLIGNITSQGSSLTTVNAVISDLPVSGSSEPSGLPPYLDVLGSNQANFAPDEIIVKFKATTKIQTAISADKIAVTGLSSIDALHKKLNVTSIEKIFKGKKPKGMKLRRTALPTEESPDLSNIYKLKIGKEITVPEAVEMYQQDPNVEYAEPNYVVNICFLPNDPYYYTSGSWGQSYQDLWGLYKIQTSSAWDINRGEGVVVAVIDSGIDYNHPDIDQNVWINTAEANGISGVDDDANGYTDDIRGWDFYNNDNNPMDDHGHGTHVSGTIAAEGNNGIGVIGVAYNSKIMALKGLGIYGGYDSDLAEAIAYAADNSADILSNSWGGEGESQLLEDAVNYAYSLGCVIAAAAGNDNWNVSYFYPAALENVIAVSAFDNNDVKASWSNWGPKIDVAAPGVGVLSLRGNGTDMYGDGTHIVGQNYYWANGTSMACPHVAGVAALILSNHPEFTNEQVRQALRISADDVDQAGWDINSGYGRINAYKALLVSNPAEAKITSPCNSQYFKKQVEIRGTVGGQFDEWRLYYSPAADSLNETLIQSGVTYEVNYIWDITSALLGDYCIKLKVFNQGLLCAVDMVEITIGQWVARYNYPPPRAGIDNENDEASAIAVDAQGNVYVTGRSKGFVTYYDYATIKYDTNGNQLWVARYNGPGNYNDEATAIAVDASGNVYVTGFSHVNSTYNDYATIKYDTNGNQLWVARYDGPGSSWDWANAIAVDAQGNVYVTGQSYRSGTDYDYATIKYDTNGNQLWVATYDGTRGNGKDKASAVALDTEGNVYVTGESAGSGTGSDYATIKYDTNGNRLWVARYNSPGNNYDRAYAIAVDASANVYVTGYSYISDDGSYGRDAEYVTVKYDTNGNRLWEKYYKYSSPSQSYEDDEVSAIALDILGNVYVTGRSYGYGTYYDYATIKYYQSQDGGIEGKVILQNRSNYSASVVFELRNPNEFTPIKTYTITTDSQGNFNLINVPAGTYDLTAKGSNFLRAKQSGVLVLQGQITPNVNFSLSGGDADNNNVVNAFDNSILNGAFGSAEGSPSWNAGADFDNNKVVNAFDNSILNGNFGKSGAQ